MSNDPRIEVVITGNTDGLRKATNQATESLDDFADKSGATSSQMKTHWEGLQGSVMGIRAAWLQVAGVVAAGAWLIDGAKQALDGEKAMNKLRIQVEGLGLDYSSLKGHIEGAIDATSRYALVQDDDVAAVLQQLIFLTGDYAGSVENLNLIFDLAYQRNLSHAEAANIVGKAMTGNLDAVGKLIPEFKGLEDTLGKNATQAEKAAMAMELFRGKVSGATGEMTEHGRKVAEVTLAYNRLKEGIGNVALEIASLTLKNLQAPFEWYDSATGAIDRAAGGLNPNMAVAAQVDPTYPFSMNYRPKINRGGKGAGTDTGATKLTVPDSGSLQAFVMGGLDMPELSEKLGITGYDLGQAFVESFSAGAKEAENGLSSDDLSFSMGAVTTTDAGLWDAYNANLDAQYALEQTHTDRMLDMHLQAEETMQGFLRDRLYSYDGYYTVMADMGQKFTDEEIKQALRRKDLQVHLASETFGLLTNTMQNLYIATGSKHKQLFNLMKVFGYAETVINTSRAAMGAYAALAGIPIVGPALATMAATAAIAAGAAQLKIISSANPGSATSAIGFGGTANPSYSGGSPTAYPVPTRAENPQPTQHITINIHNPLNGEIADSAAESVIDLINRGGKMNYRIDAQVIQAN